MNAIVVEKRDFVRNMSKYLKIPGIYHLRGREEDMEVEIRREVHSKTVNSYVGI